MRKFLVLSVVLAGALLVGCSSEGSKTGTTPGKKPGSGLSTGAAGGAGGSGRELGGTGLDLNQHVVYFDFDSSELKPEAQPVIGNWAKYLSQNPSARVRLEGHTDERGTREYNIAL